MTQYIFKKVHSTPEGRKFEHWVPPEYTVPQMTKATMETLLSYILTIPLYMLFTILKRAIDNIFVNEEDQETFFNSVADSLIERNYATEKAISDVFNALNIYRNPPIYGACGFRCDGCCRTCTISGDGGAGVSWNESGYYD